MIPYPALLKHLHAITFHPKGFGGDWPVRIDWILFPAWVDSFDENTMLDPLIGLIVDKAAHYGSTRVGLAAH